jgi:VWFA-related protein
MQMRTKGPEMCLLVVCLFAFTGAARTALARPQDQQQPSPGPKPSADEGVYIPKKTQPAPHSQPGPAAQPDKRVEPEKKLERINPNEVSTLSVSTDVVNVDVTVLDKNGNPIPSLGRKNFQLLDDGVPQTISNFSMAEAPITVCMLVEFSSNWWGFLYLALEYGYQFLNFMQPKDWLAIVDFDMKPHILTDFTQDRYQARSALDSLRIPGFSEINLYDALAFTLDRMKDIKGRKAILAICTGIDTFSKLTYGDMLKLAKASDATIYPVSVLEFLDVRTMGSMTAVAAKAQLTYIAQYSGGQAYFPRFEGDLPGIYQQVAGQLRQQYSLGFVPTNPSRDGKFHKLKVELVDNQGSPLRIVDQKGKNVKYRIIAREGYYSPKS